MVDQLGNSRDEVVMIGAVSALGSALVVADEDYRDEFEGTASVGPAYFLSQYAANIAHVASTTGPWDLDDGEV